MEPRTTLPLEILACIIDLLGAEKGRNMGSLQNLSQACRSFVPLCRKYIFSSLVLSTEYMLKSFGILLSTNPDIARYVRHIRYVVRNTVGDHDLNILYMLKERSSLQSIEILPSPVDVKPEWNSFPESIRSSLVLLLQLPTLTLLIIFNFKGFPTTALSHCSNLIEFRLGRLEIAPPEVNQVISRSKIPTPVHIKAERDTYDGLAILSNYANLYAGGPIIDFSRLQEAAFDVGSLDDIGHVNELIKVTTQLQHLDIAMEWPAELVGFGASLATNAYQTLKELKIYINVEGDDYDPLCGFSRELRFIAEKNVLETLRMDVVIGADTPCRTESEDWSDFDSVLTESGAFPRLLQVTVEIRWISNGKDEDDLDEVLMESLKEHKFPRLMESKTVDFEFISDIHYYDEDTADDSDLGGDSDSDLE